METKVPNTVDTSQLAIIQKKLYLDNRIRSAVNWFYIIAGLSLVNTIIFLTGNTLTFIVGLGVTQIVDIFAATLAKRLGQGWGFIQFVAFGIDVCIAGGFALVGYLGRKRYRWAIIVGMILYAFDGVILILFQVYLAAAFHAWALFSIGGSLKSLKDLEILEKYGDSESIESIRQRMPAVPGYQTTITPQQRKTRWILTGLIFLVILSGFVFISLQK